MADEDVTPEIDEGAGEAPSVVAEPDAPAGWDGWGDLAEDDIVKRHGGDPVKLAQSYKELQRVYHAERSQPTPAATEEPETPWEPLQDVAVPQGLDPEFYGRVAQSYQLDPVGTLRELVEGGPKYEAYVDQVYEALEGQIGKARAMRIFNGILNEQNTAQVEALLAERVDAQVTPITNDAKTSKVSAGIDLAKAAIGDEAWAEFEPYLSSIVPPEGLPAHVIESPTAVRDTLIELQQWQVFRKQQALNAAGQAPAPTAPTPRKGTQATLGGNTASRPDEQSYADKVRADLKNTKIRITD